MRVRRIHPFDLPPKDAMRLQTWLAGKVVERGHVRGPLRLVAGVDCALGRDGHVHAAVVLCKAPSWEPVETASASAPPLMPYVPGLLSFREAPIVLEALRKLRTLPQAVLVDGHGLAHPRCFGLACHVGLHVDVPVIGVGKSLLCGIHREPGKKHGDWRPIELAGRRVGVVLTTRDDTSPIYVSVGNRIGLLPAARLVLKTATKYRLPEPIRHADALSRRLARSSGRALAR